MSAGGPIAAIVVLGAGVVGHAAAIAFRRALPRASVTLIETPPDARAITERIGAATAALHDFHRQIGLDALIFQRETAAVPSFGTRFSATPHWMLFEGEDAHFVDGIALHQLWLRHARTMGDRAAPWHVHSRRHALLDSHHATLDESAGVRFDPQRYRTLLARLARHLGIETIRTQGWSAEMRDGHVAALTLDDGRVVAGDLFADCAGPDAKLLHLVTADFEHWDDHLPRLQLVDTAPSVQPGAQLDALALTPDGVTIDTGAGRHRFTASDDAPHPGRRVESWSSNVVAFGDAALIAAPFSGQLLSAALGNILRAIQLLPGRGGCPHQAREYNRRAAMEHRYVLDWSAAHWLDVDTPGLTPPRGLEHLLAQFGSRGRIPFRDGDPFTAGDWIAMLIGKGIRPERIDPTARVPADDQVNQLLVHVRDRTARIDTAA